VGLVNMVNVSDGKFPEIYNLEIFPET
jgi:hypothetical protein